MLYILRRQSGVWTAAACMFCEWLCLYLVFWWSCVGWGRDHHDEQVPQGSAAARWSWTQSRNGWTKHHNPRVTCSWRRRRPQSQIHVDHPRNKSSPSLNGTKWVILLLHSKHNSSSQGPPSIISHYAQSSIRQIGLENCKDTSRRICPKWRYN